jgi:hypothetical protein
MINNFLMGYICHELGVSCKETKKNTIKSICYMIGAFGVLTGGRRIVWGGRPPPDADADALPKLGFIGFLVIVTHPLLFFITLIVTKRGSSCEFLSQAIDFYWKIGLSRWLFRTVFWRFPGHSG